MRCHQSGIALAAAAANPSDSFSKAKALMPLEGLGAALLVVAAKCPQLQLSCRLAH